MIIRIKYPVMVVLNHEKIKKDRQRIVKIRPLIDRYN